MAAGAIGIDDLRLWVFPAWYPHVTAFFIGLPALGWRNRHSCRAMLPNKAVLAFRHVC